MSTKARLVFVGLVLVLLGFFVYDKGTGEANLDAYANQTMGGYATDSSAGDGYKLGGGIVMGVGAIFVLVGFVITLPKPD